MSNLNTATARVDELRTKTEKLAAEIGNLGDKPNLTAGQSERLENLMVAHSRANTEYLEARQDRIAEIQSTEITRERGQVTRGDGYAARVGGNSLHDDARRSIEDATRSAGLPAEAAEKAEQLVVDGPRYERDLAARWAIATGNPAYVSAFEKSLADPVRGHMLWTPEEQEAFREVNNWASESRTYMSNTDSAGGFLTLPLTLDPAIRLTNSGSINPLRQLAEVRQTVADTHRVVTSAGVSSEWLATQNTQAADASPTLGEVDIVTIRGSAFVAYSYEVGMDGQNFLQEITRLLLDSADQLQATAFTTGAGTTEPFGIVTGLAGTASEINTTGSEAIVSTDATALQNALPARFSANASWLMNIATINTFGAFETTNGAVRYPSLGEGRLLNKPVYELSNLDGSINAVATANNYVAIYGDIRETFVIVDRIGAQIELIPNLMGANNRPTGTRGAFLWFRTGSKVVNAAASRLLDVPTTA